MCQCLLLYNGYRGVLAGAWLRGMSSVVGGAWVCLREKVSAGLTLMYVWCTLKVAYIKVIKINPMYTELCRE